MQPIYAGFFASFVHHRTPQGKSVCHVIKMMSDDDRDDCAGLFDRLFYVAIRFLKGVMKISNLYSIAVCTVDGPKGPAGRSSTRI